MTSLKSIPLADIDMVSNYREVEPVSNQDPDILDLAESIRKEGVLQPVLVRPHPARADRYELVFGHRRYIASRVAGLEEIPANIKAIEDEDILEIQVTENLQRKDVHPLDEAVAFREYMKQKKYSVEEVAARFGKKPDFITQRLKLNDLAPALQKDFKTGKMLLGHALLICRLSPEDQLHIHKNESPVLYGTVEDLRDTIECDIMRKLSAAPFKQDDLTLYPKAGACTVCPKRSGANPLLFPDVKENDRCFDKACFETKLHAFAQRKIREVIETEPDMLLLSNRNSKTLPSINNLIQKMHLQPKQEYRDFETSVSTYNNFTKKAKGIWINSDKMGKVVTVYIKAAAKKDGSVKPESVSAEDLKADIETIKSREKRAKELDLEKVHKATLEKLQDHKSLKTPSFPYQFTDRAIMLYLLLHECAGQFIRDEIRKVIKQLPKDPPYNPHAFQLDYFVQLDKLTRDEEAFIIRKICLSKYGNPKTVSAINASDTTLRLIADYLCIDLTAIEAEQAEKAAKRQERVNKRIKELQDLVKEKNKGAKAPASKKASKLKNSLSDILTKDEDAENEFEEQMEEE